MGRSGTSFIQEYGKIQKSKNLKSPIKEVILDRLSTTEKFLKFKNLKFVHKELLDDFYDRLEPVSPSDLFDDWKGGYFYTGNNWGLFLKMPILKWYGKRFRSHDDVDALVFQVFGVKFALPIGKSFLIKLKYRKKVSTAMKYKFLPVRDHFRKIDKNTLMGIMDANIPLVNDFYFYLERVK